MRLLQFGLILGFFGLIAYVKLAEVDCNGELTYYEAEQCAAIAANESGKQDNVARNTKLEQAKPDAVSK